MHLIRIILKEALWNLRHDAQTQVQFVIVLEEADLAENTWPKKCRTWTAADCFASYTRCNDNSFL